MLSKISVAALLAATASVGAVPSSAPWQWCVKNFTSHCRPSVCSYGFNVSAPVGPSGQPSFDASGCIGDSVQGEYKSCFTVGVDVPGDVLAQEINAGNDVGATLRVRYTFEQNGVKYTYTGASAVSHEGAPADFEITPTEVTAVPVEG